MFVIISITLNCHNFNVHHAIRVLLCVTYKSFINIKFHQSFAHLSGTVKQMITKIYTACSNLESNYTIGRLVVYGIGPDYLSISTSSILKSFPYKLIFD